MELTPARQAAVVAAVEAVALLIFTIAVAIASLNPRGSSVGSAPIAEVIVYLSFVIGLALIARGLWRRSVFARTPMVLAQAFGLVSAWLFLEGDGAAVLAGVLLVVVCVLGIVLTVRPATSADLRE